MEDDSGGRSPLVLADSCAADEEQKNKKNLECRINNQCGF